MNINRFDFVVSQKMKRFSKNFRFSHWQKNLKKFFDQQERLHSNEFIVYSSHRSPRFISFEKASSSKRILRHFLLNRQKLILPRYCLIKFNHRDDENSSFSIDMTSKKIQIFRSPSSRCSNQMKVASERRSTSLLAILSMHMDRNQINFSFLLLSFSF